MRLVLRAVAVLGLTHLYTMLIYRWPPLARIIERAVDSAWGQRAYVRLMDLVGWEGAEHGETLLLIIFLLVSLVMASVTVVIVSRFIVTPLCRRHAAKGARG